MADGVFCEFAVFEIHELSRIPYAPGRFIWRRSGVDEALARPQRPLTARRGRHWLVGEALSNLILGLQRHARREKLSAMRLIQVHALDRVLEWLELRQPAAQDPWAAAIRSASSGGSNGALPGPRWTCPCGPAATGTPCLPPCRCWRRRRRRVRCRWSLPRTSGCRPGPRVPRQPRNAGTGAPASMPGHAPQGQEPVARPPAAAEFILYVQDQGRSNDFYERVLGVSPRLRVPGMTEFDLPGGATLGLMPEAGIKKLLGERLPDPGRGRGRGGRGAVSRGGRTRCLSRALAAGATELAPLQARSWGHLVLLC